MARVTPRTMCRELAKGDLVVLKSRSVTTRSISKKTLLHEDGNKTTISQRLIESVCCHFAVSEVINSDKSAKFTKIYCCLLRTCCCLHAHKFTLTACTQCAFRVSDLKQKSLH